MSKKELKTTQSWPKSVFHWFSLQRFDHISMEMFRKKKLYFDSMINSFFGRILDHFKANAYNPD